MRRSLEVRSNCKEIDQDRYSDSENLYDRVNSNYNILDSINGVDDFNIS